MDPFRSSVLVEPIKKPSTISRMLLLEVYSVHDDLYLTASLFRYWHYLYICSYVISQNSADHGAPLLLCCPFFLFSMQDLRDTVNKGISENDFILSVIYKGVPSHHRLARGSEGEEFSLNKTPTGCSTLADFVEKYRTKQSKWPVPLTEGVVGNAGGGGGGDNTEWMHEGLKKATADELLLADGGDGVMGKFLLRRTSKDVDLAAAIQAEIQYRKETGFSLIPGDLRHGNPAGDIL